MHTSQGQDLHNHSGPESSRLISNERARISFSTSIVSTAPRTNAPRQNLPEDNNNTYNNGSLRMKRYNSLPDVAEYLDPNPSDSYSSKISNSTANMVNNYPEPQLDSLMVAFSHAQMHRKVFPKPYFDQSTNTVNDPRVHVPNMSLPNFLPVHSNPPSTQVSLRPDQPFTWQDRSNLPFLSNTQFDSVTIDDRSHHEPNLINNYNYNSQLYTHSSIRNLNSVGSQLPPSSPHFSQTMYMHPNHFKRLRPDQPQLNDEFPSQPIPSSSLYNLQSSTVRDVKIPGQQPPSPDSATTQAAADAIAASAQITPPADADDDSEMAPRRQHLRYAGDLYTPQWVRGTAHKKEGYCDLCQPGKWLQLKNSAFWYHKQFFHGISSVSGKFFSGPIQTRQRDSDIIEGLCHQCNQWVQMSSPKRRNSVLWFRHAHKCHVYHKPKNIYEPTED